MAMEVPRSWLDGYTDALNKISEDGQTFLVEQLRAIDYDRPIAEIREDVVSLMEVCCGGSAQMSAQQTAIFYDGMRERVIGDAMGAHAQSQREPIATEKAVKAFLQKLIEGDYDAFESLCKERLDYEVKRAAGKCTEYNVKSDPYKGETRYARVPTGEETCDFCIMLASRGPVYHTEETAGAYDHYHANCDCRIVPFWGTYYIGPSRRASVMGIQGYNPDDLYNKYLGMMLNPKFADRMARAADRAKRGRTERDSAITWEQASKKGLTQFKDIHEVTRTIRESTSYDELCANVKAIGKEIEYYGLSDKTYENILELCRSTRERLISEENREGE